MSENLLNLAIVQFSTNLELKVQQLVSRIRGKVAEGAHRGRLASPVNYIAPVKMKAPTGRFAPKQRTDADFERRWVSPLDREIDQYIDTFDELRLIIDPKSQYSSNAAAAVGREWDDQLINAAFGSALTGTDVDGLSTESFATYIVADNFGASASTGLTVQKLIELKRLMRHYAQDGNPDNEQLTLIMGSQQEADLLGQVQVASTDYNDRPVLVDGKISRFMGFDIVVMERLTADTVGSTGGATTRKCIGVMKSGLYLGIWKDMASEAFRRPDLSSNPWDLNTLMSSGATRLQKGKLFRVDCKDSTGASIVA
jgi:hypothetical protein